MTNDTQFNALIEAVASAADDIERAAHIPDELAGQLKAAGLFSMLLPATLGGREMPLPAYISLVQQFALADGSVAWCINQGSVLASIGHRFDPERARDIWHSPNVTVANGPPAGGRAIATSNGFNVTGRWTFSSGIRQADYLIGMAPTDSGGPPRWCFFPKSSATIDESWPTRGLRGTASYSFSVSECFVPDAHAIPLGPERTQVPLLYRIPLNLLFASGFAAVALGVSRGAIDFATNRVRNKVKRFDDKAMARHQLTQADIGVAEARWRAADALLHNTVTHAWENTGEVMLEAAKMDLRLAATHVIRESKAVTDMAYDLCSTDSIFEENEIQRRFQDIHVISQHLQGRPEIYATVGAYLLDVDFDRTMVS